ncbi:DUF2484 family protein [Oceanibium sediminis]|uniref:DUF2484 family protein n=1 Tax=Oceanibium sediminis TaxID=2026339 RepID=UPI000DD383E2|nr:DUF2484 family protein [Oceanibium sediminis]
MTPSLALAAIWAVAANVIAMLPSRRNHWPAAYGLIAVGVPIIVYVFWENGALIGAAVLLAAASILRWPLRYLWRWARARLARPRGE